MGQWVVSVLRHEPPSESGISPGRFPWRSYRAGTRLVHHQSTTGTSPALPDLVLEGNRELLGHDYAARAESRPARSVARHGTVPVFYSAAGGAHSITASVQPRWDGAGYAVARPAASTTRPARRLARAERRRNRPPGMHGMHQLDEQFGRPVTGQNGRGSAKRAVLRTAPSTRTLSAYLHRRGDGKWFLVVPFTVWGRASLCSLALIAAGPCERAAGSGGAERPHGGAAGALDAAARERIMGRRGQGSELGSAVSGLAWGLSCRGPGDLLHDGTGGGEGTARLT